MLEAADDGQQTAYAAAVREVELCRALLEQLQSDPGGSPQAAEQIRRLQAQAEVGMREAVMRVERCRRRVEERFSE